jgi:hypothetical protein
MAEPDTGWYITVWGPGSIGIAVKKHEASAVTRGELDRKLDAYLAMCANDEAWYVVVRRSTPANTTNKRGGAIHDLALNQEAFA